MTSKLMGMKFMQRSAAKALSVSTPDSGQNTPRKRQRAADGSLGESQSSTPQYASADDNAEGHKLAALLDKQAEAAGDTHWTVGPSTPVQASPSSGLRVVTMGYDVIDTPERDRGALMEVEEADETGLPCLTRTKSGGRMSFGKVKDKTARQRNPDAPDAPLSGGTSDEEHNEDDLSSLGEDEGSDADMDVVTSRRLAHARDRAEAKAAKEARRKMEKEEAKRDAASKNQANVKLSRLSTISGVGGGGGGGRGPMKCFTCGGNHKKAECPSSKDNKQRRR